MAVQGRNWSSFLRRRKRVERPAPSMIAPQSRPAETTELQIAPDDPIVAYFQHSSGAVDIEHLKLDSPALEAMRAASVRLVVPLVSQGELIGLLNLGPRLSQQEYSTDDRTLLNNLATQTAPAVRVAQLVRQKQVEDQARERIDQELRVARHIQQTLLPKRLPQIPGWQLGAHYQPARAVGGDFYDFLELSDGRLGLVVGDVTDKGVPAALVMASTRSVLRAAASRLESPGVVLGRVNDLVHPDVPPNMFITCMYAILDPVNGNLVYANAGHDLPFHRHGSSVVELHARGMPLGLMPGMEYEEKTTVLAPGDRVLFYSDGLVEAHDPHRQMFSFGRLQRLIAEHQETDAPLVPYLLHELERFTGPGWEQEDDITLVTLQRSEEVMAAGLARHEHDDGSSDSGRVLLTQFTIPSEAGNERIAMRQVADAVRQLELPPERVEKLKTAVAEATMNAMEHGNKFQPEVPVTVRVYASHATLSVGITDQGGAPPDMGARAPKPDIEAKLANLQTARGWGLFLIENMVDELHVTSGEQTHTVELVLKLTGGNNGDEPA